MWRTAKALFWMRNVASSAKSEAAFHVHVGEGMGSELRSEMEGMLTMTWGFSDLWRSEMIKY